MPRNKSEKGPVLLRQRSLRHNVHREPHHTLRLMRIGQSEWRLTLSGEARFSIDPCSMDYDNVAEATGAYVAFPDGFAYTQHAARRNGWFQNPEAKLSAT